MKKPLVSIVICCYNEALFIEGVLNNILDQTYPVDAMEILVVDGGSTDGTRTIVNTFEQRYSCIRLVDNPDKFVPHALNRGIQTATGDYIAIMGAHSGFPKNYIHRLVEWILQTKVAVVGGVCMTKERKDTPKARAIALILAHPFGVGNSLFRTGIKEAMKVDTVAFGLYQRSIFKEIGLFDHRLIRNQDIELNKRIVLAGKDILLVPDVSFTYYARDTFSGLWKNNFGNGKWVVLTAWYTKNLKALSIRHFIPLFFALYLFLVFVFIFCGMIWPLPYWSFIFLLPLLFYGLFISITSLRMSLKQKNFSVFFYAWCSFIVLHLSYGLGSMRGVFSAMKLKS